MIIPIWRKRTGKNETQYWGPAAHYVSGHQGRNRVPYKRTSIDRARISETAKRNWVAGKYNNKILKKTIIMRRKLWKILKEHPEGLTVKEIMEITGIKKTTLIYWIKTQQYMKFDAHRGKGPGRPYIIKLAKEPPVNLEDEMCWGKAHQDCQRPKNSLRNRCLLEKQLGKSQRTKWDTGIPLRETKEICQ